MLTLKSVKKFFNAGNDVEKLKIELNALYPLIYGLEAKIKTQSDFQKQLDVLGYKVDNKALYNIGQEVNNFIIMRESFYYNNSVDRIIRQFECFNKITKQYKTVDEELIGKSSLIETKY